MLEQTLSAAFGQLRLADDPLSEGKVELLAFNFTPELQTHFKQVIGFAYLQWGKLPLNESLNLEKALTVFNIRLGHYFKDPNALASPLAILGPQELRAELSREVMSIVGRLIHDKSLFEQITAHPMMRKCLADLCMLQAYFLHEEIADLCLSDKSLDLTLIQKKIFLARSTFKRLDSFPISYDNKALEQQLIALKRALLQHIYILECQYIPDALGFNELQFHIDRKNALAKEKHTSYYAELIFNRNAYQQHSIDQSVIDMLIERIKLIKNEQQPRTQFIVDVLGVGHTMVVDVALNKETDTVDIICVEPACLGFQADFLKQLQKGLVGQSIPNTRTIGIQTGLLKDYHSCYTLSLALSSEVAKFTFDALLKQPAIPQPTFLRGHNSGPESKLVNTTWLDVTALGEKVVMMAQSFTAMKANLLKMFPHKEVKVDTMIKDLKAGYGMGGKIDSLGNAAHEQSYSHVKRASLRQKTTQNPYSDLTVPKVLAKMNTQAPDQALRRLAAGYGPCRDMRFLIEECPASINIPGAKTGSTALHFAYQHHKLGRAYHLEYAKADQNAQDKMLRKPSDLRKA